MSVKANKFGAKAEANRSRLREGMDGSASTVIAAIAEEDEAAPTLVVVPALPEEPVATDRADEVTAVAEAVEVMTPEPAVEQTTVQPDNQTTAVAEAATVQQPAARKARVTKETWREFAVGAAGPGQSESVERVNITVTADLMARLTALDSQLAAEGSRHVINRNALLAAAIDLIAADPENWETKAAQTDTPATKNLQGRVNAERGTTLNKVRRPPTGKRNTSAMLAAAVEHLLA